MTLLVAIALAFFAWSNRYISGSSLYPPVIFSALWSLYLLLLCIAGDFFYPISPEALLVYSLGVLAFAIGGLAELALSSMLCKKGALSFRQIQASYDSELVSKAINYVLVLLIIGLLLYLKNVIRADATTSGINFFMAMRQENLAKATAGAHASLIDNLVVVSIIVALVAFYESKSLSKRKFRACLAILVSLIYNLMSGSIAGAVPLLVSLLGIYWIYNRRIKIKLLLPLVVIFLAVFSMIAIFLGKGEVNPNAGFFHNLPAIGKGLAQYSLGGIVAFDRVAQNPSSIRPVWQIDRFFLRTAKRLGCDVDVSSLHAAYTDISPSRDINVYTIYFAYLPHFGLTGVILIMFFLGIVLTWNFRMAMRGSPAAIVFYGILFYGLVLSNYSENFFLSLNFFIKLGMFLWLLYVALPRFRKGLLSYER